MGRCVGNFAVAYVATGKYVRMAVYSAYSCITSTSQPERLSIFIFVGANERKLAVQTLDEFDERATTKIRLLDLAAIAIQRSDFTQITATQLARFAIPEILKDYEIL